MKLNRRFNYSRINLKAVPKFWVVISIVMGLLSALTIYSFFYVIREAFRVMTFGFENFPYILSEEDRYLYNLFFAGLSVIFGNSMTIALLLSKPSNALSKRSPLRKLILNDQVFLNFNFFYWFAKMGMCFFVLSMCCMDFDFTPYVGFLSTLLLVVMYLDSWKGLSRAFKNNRFKFQALHLSLIILLTFCLSKLDVIDHKTLDASAIKSRPMYALPHSDFYDEIYKFNYRETKLSLKLNVNSELEIWHYGRRGNINDLYAIIASERISIREELIPYLYVRISADKSLALKHIKKVEALLYRINQRNIIYDVYNDDLLTRRFERRGIKFKIPYTVMKLEPYKLIPPMPLREVAYFDRSRDFNKILTVEIGNIVKMDGVIVGKETLKEDFKKYIKRDVMFEYSYDDLLIFQDYIKVLSAHRAAVFELREQHQTIFIEDTYRDNKNYREDQYKLKLKFPMLLIENFD